MFKGSEKVATLLALESSISPLFPSGYASKYLNLHRIDYSEFKL